jgi:hypothetical protein
MRRTLFALALPLALALETGCNDPVHDAQIAALGPEDPAVPVGPLHRPGQPCLACHDGNGPASLAFGTAGTVFQDAMDPTPMVSAIVQLTDAATNVTSAETNCAGNFFVELVDWTPVFPVHVQVIYGDMSSQMLSHFDRYTSCAQCHTGTVSSSSVGQIYLNADPMAYLPSGCPQ